MSAAVIAAVTFVLSAYIIPPANVKRIDYTNTYVRNKRVVYGQNIQMQVAPGQIAYMSSYNNTVKTGDRFSLERFDDKQLKSRLTARSIIWKGGYQWTVRDYVIRDFVDNREIITKGSELDTIIPIEPRDFLISKNDHEMMTTPELQEYISRQKERGVANIKGFEIENPPALRHDCGGIYPDGDRHGPVVAQGQGRHGGEYRYRAGAEFQLYPVHDRHIDICRVGLYVADGGHVDTQHHICDHSRGALPPRLQGIKSATATDSARAQG